MPATANVILPCEEAQGQSLDGRPIARISQAIKEKDGAGHFIGVLKFGDVAAHELGILAFQLRLFVLFFLVLADIVVIAVFFALVLGCSIGLGRLAGFIGAGLVGAGFVRTRFVGAAFVGAALVIGIFHWTVFAVRSD